MASSGSGYDLSSSTFSPDGRIFQVEYATKGSRKFRHRHWYSLQRWSRSWRQQASLAQNACPSLLLNAFIQYLQVVVWP